MLASCTLSINCLQKLNAPYWLAETHRSLLVPCAQWRLSLLPGYLPVSSEWSITNHTFSLCSISILNHSRGQ